MWNIHLADGQVHGVHGSGASTASTRLALITVTSRVARFGRDNHLLFDLHISRMWTRIPKQPDSRTARMAGSQSARMSGHREARGPQQQRTEQSEILGTNIAISRRHSMDGHQRTSTDTVDCWCCPFSATRNLKAVSPGPQIHTQMQIPVALTEWIAAARLERHQMPSMRRRGADEPRLESTKVAFD
ncbi:uncharacterized protein LOC122626587 [Drosophila teissieri]|uniref:uncharacterized protein LOC122626587 n=1 Tax=Drosophila teissieri TaxID=7243 RepID=UPI001CBA1608|nr:uncharacterized protein LOC122626587 [Drosophila teissieri]